MKRQDSSRHEGVWGGQLFPQVGRIEKGCPSEPRQAVTKHACSYRKAIQDIHRQKASETPFL